MNILEKVREDDFVEYHIFPNSRIKDNKEEELMINSVLREVKAITKKHTKGYLWHRDEFSLCARTTVSNVLCNEENRESLPAHLYGVSHYGDNIEDEWFIVYLLIQLTKEINDLIVRVVDVDGEFILIEAAESLPAWAKPENCENRVYIYNGLVHIVAPESSEEDEDDFPSMTVKEAIDTVRSNPSLTVASNEIQQAIRDKLKGYPEKVKQNLHRTKIYLPVGVAAILENKPNLIAPAVHAFCNRDSVDLRACRAMKYFPPENRVHTSVTFTKCLYAMITHSKYVPDRKTGWNLPLATSPQYKAQSLGVKVACGFEILISQAKPTSDIEGDKGWNVYLKTLKEKNYFRDLLEHSQEYNNLLNKAKEYYTNNRDSMQCTPAIGQEILELTKTLDYNIDNLKKNEDKLPEDDDEEWLNISPEELDKMLFEQYGQKKTMNISNGTDASNFTKKITSFLEQISDVDGAEFPMEEAPVRPPRTKKSSNDKTENNGAVNFDANSFSCAVQNILSFVIPEDDSWDMSDSDMEDYEKEETTVDYGDLKNKMQEYMKQMDAELAATTIGQSFEKKEEPFDDIENFKPVDIDMNALKNILESYKCQMGEAGPSSNMLGPMGIHLDKEVSGADSD